MIAYLSGKILEKDANLLIIDVGGVGYEDIEASQRSALLTAGGDPVVDGNGRFQLLDRQRTAL